jgi:tetratricopeptide (TPR) repeat protein
VLVSAWTIWQPLRSANADQAALAALDRGDIRGAVADANIAAARNPLSAEPLWDLSAIYDAAGDRLRARAELERAVRLQPSNPATWQQLGEYDLQIRRPREAVAVLRAALYLDPHSLVTLSAIAQAQQGLQTPAAPRTSTR